MKTQRDKKRKATRRLGNTRTSRPRSSIFNLQSSILSVASASAPLSAIALPKENLQSNSSATAPHKVHNRIAIAPIVRCICLTGFLTLMGIGFVHIKNQQHALGSEMRLLERSLRDLHSYNKALQAEVTHLTCRASLQQKLATGFVKMVAIQDTCIARLTPPLPTPQTGAIQTASNQNF